nr:uncharacterized protein LOC119165558 [Rhipicephalus microplus]
MYKRLLVVIMVLYVAGKTNTNNHLPTRLLHKYSIKDFFNSSECIWMCKASMRIAIRFQYDQMTKIDSRFIFFKRTFLIRGQRRSIELRGELNPRHMDRMDVSSRGLPAVLRETLVYEARNSSCAVVKIRPNIQGAASYYELRVKNTCNRAVIHRRCWRHYYSVTDQEKKDHGPE